MHLSAGMFVRFTDSDDNGKFHHDGEVTSTADGRITFETDIGTLSVSESEIERFTVIQRPAGWSVQTHSSACAAAPKQSKRDFVFAYIKAHPGLIRKDLIDQIVQEIEISPATVSTYIALAKKA